MSLYGALFSGVSGLNAQSNKLGVISDNISNVNTVGYKGVTGVFGTLVTSSATTSAYSPGGVLGTARQTISTQGLLQSTSSPTDIGIQGNGFFVVNQSSDGTGAVQYTRAGSFTADATGNYRNTAGLYLQAWPLDRDGRLPGEPGNLDTTSSANLASLKTVNVTSLTGSAAATSSVSLSANLRSTQTAFIGASGVVTMDSLDVRNSTIAAKDVIVPSDVNGTQRGDAFTVSTGQGVSYTYVYGGFTYGRDISDGTNGDSGIATLTGQSTLSGVEQTLNDTPVTLNNNMSVDANGIITITSVGHGLKTGDHVAIVGATDFGGMTAATAINTAGGFTVTVLTDDTYTIDTGLGTGNTTPATNAGGSAIVSPQPMKIAANGDITVSAPAHGLAVGDPVTLSGLTAAVSGVASTSINNQTFIVKSITDDNHYVLGSSLVGSGTFGGTGTIVQTDDPFKITSSSKDVIVRQVGHGLKTGDVVTLSGSTADVGNISATQLNNTFKATVIDDDHYKITVSSTATSTTGGGSGTIIAETRPFIGNILDATNANQPFLGTTTTAPFSTAALSFTISTSTTGTVKFTYTASTPNSQTGQFNNLTNLADAINAVNGLSARVVNNRIYISATDSNEAVTFANVQDTADDTGTSVLAGIDWVRELGLRDVVSGSNRFATMEGLASIVNNSPGLTGTVENAISDSSLNINVLDPLDTISFSDRATSSALPSLSGNQFTTINGSKIVQITMPSNIAFSTGDVVHINGASLPGAVNGIPKADFTGDFEITKTGNNTFTIQVADAATSGGVGDATGLVVTPPNNHGSILAALGLVDSLNGSSYTTPETTSAIGPAYDPTSPTKNMASGSIPPHSTRPATIFDAQGTGHNINMSFLKVATNTWAVEVYVTPASDVSSVLPNGQIAYGTLSFNGDGTLRSVSSTLSAAASVQWTNGAAASTVNFNWGTAGQPAGTPNATVIGLADGMSQQSADYSLNFVKQNGAPVGQLTGVAIDRAGFITASYSNGETQKLFKIPLASFTNPDQLQSASGNAYTQTSESGEVNLKQADSSGVGFLSSSALEASNVELANQLTDMIVAQRAYQANTKVISTADQLLDNLNQILR